MERNLFEGTMRYYAQKLILVKSYLMHLKSYLIINILPESNSMNLGIKAKKILCDLQVTESTYFSRYISKKLYISKFLLALKVSIQKQNICRTLKSQFFKNL